MGRVRIRRNRTRKKSGAERRSLVPASIEITGQEPLLRDYTQTERVGSELDPESVKAFELHQQNLKEKKKKDYAYRDNFLKSGHSAVFKIEGDKVDLVPVTSRNKELRKMSGDVRPKSELRLVKDIEPEERPSEAKAQKAVDLHALRVAHDKARWSVVNGNRGSDHPEGGAESIQTPTPPRRNPTQFRDMSAAQDAYRKKLLEERAEQVPVKKKGFFARLFGR